MQGVVAQGVAVGEGQSRKDAFLKASARVHGTGGNKVWEDDEAMKRYQEQSEKAAEMFANQKEVKGGMGSSKSSQRLKQSKEMEKQASGEMQAAFTSAETRRQREVSGIGGGDEGGGGGDGPKVTLEIVGGDFVAKVIENSDFVKVVGKAVV